MQGSSATWCEGRVHNITLPFVKADEVMRMKRRDFMLAGATVASPFFVSGWTNAQEPKVNETPSPDDALEQLVEGNQRFVQGRSKCPRMTIDWLKRLKREGQRPVATILACSDSRVPLELLFDQGFGDIFSVRVAGNVVTRYGIGSMQYASQHLDTPLFIILGHQGCGAVSAALLAKKKQGKQAKGIQELLDKVHVGEIDPDADKKAQLDNAIEANVRASAKQLLDLDAKAEGYLKPDNRMLVSAVFDFATGRLRILEKHK
jgi:carbonic anhydrase